MGRAMRGERLVLERWKSKNAKILKFQNLKNFWEDVFNFRNCNTEFSSWWKENMGAQQMVGTAHFTETCADGAFSKGFAQSAQIDIFLGGGHENLDNLRVPPRWVVRLWKMKNVKMCTPPRNVATRVGVASDTGKIFFGKSYGQKPCIRVSLGGFG